MEVFLGDAREYVRRFENRFDIVYQDAFSPSVNPALWTQEYFKDIKVAMKEVMGF
ncbi:MAG: MnmC family methyltransferase [Sulfurimonas sp.]|nr:MnmC family methyltransferase [Sulfurimonas sp.]